ncbi:MAG: division/cell wall cluster transcriptional repressor MraZ [Thalassotalea sp.]|nr:division/cell wall cluster transcriptional repressor MraZ [Thalassotalea sp.]MDG2393162.1 division/cell wall cluster transcriptional repressor MraZ [Thalassotalea sp.]
MFLGTNKVTLDSKNRITIPTKYRDDLFTDFEGKMVCTIDVQNACLLLYPAAAWEKIKARISSLSDFNKAERTIKRILLGNAHACELDKNGRILMTPSLREHANLGKNVVLVGLDNKFEIWDESAWQLEQATGLEQLQSGELEFPERLQELSI